MLETLLNQHQEWSKLSIKEKIKHSADFYFKLLRSKLTKKALSENGKKGTAKYWGGFTPEERSEELRRRALVRYGIGWKKAKRLRKSLNE